MKVSVITGASSGIGKDLAEKAANTRYFETLALELPNAKVISLLPDYIDTPMLRELPPSGNRTLTRSRLLK
jgi:NAD(P)-dependent dehydrogenase (short-subunit alcohol dehydrogenase family)